MKKKFTKILGVGLTLALLCSLLLTAAPVSADVSKPTADVDETEISYDGAIYTTSFRINTALEVADDPTITVKFPDDTDVTAVGDGDITIEATSGIGSGSGTVDAVTVTIDPDDPIVEIELDELGAIGTKIGAMAYVQVTIADVTNPTEPGTYTLEVMTSAEDTYVESESYTIGVPVVGGFVYVYNPSNILLATYGGKEALDSAVTYFAKADYTITVGPGSYDLEGTLNISGVGLTLESSEGAEDTIINASASVIPSINITGDDVTVVGFTVDGSAQDGIVINYGTTGVTVKNNIITNANDSGIVLNYDPAAGATVVVAEATVSGNVIEDSGCGINIMAGALDNTISGNTITGCSNESINIDGGLTDTPTKGNTITGNTITANQTMGILLCKHWRTNGYTFFEGNVIEGNTISENEGNGIEIADTATGITGLEILNNVITDNEEDGIWIDVTLLTGNVIKFNTITGNDNGIIISIDAVDATFNWWGTDVAADIGDMVSADVTYEPFLTDTAEATIVAGKAVGNVSSLDAKSTVGVKVSGVTDDAETTPKNADTICALKYAANPEEAISDAIAFYDVYVTLESDIVLADVEATLKFYDTAITAGSSVLFWTGDFWALCSDQEARLGLVWVTVTEDTAPALDELAGTPFVVVGGVAVAFGAPTILAPEVGDDTVSLTPIFAWEAVPDADGYYFEFADNANFVTPLVKLDGDLGRLVVTAYAYVGELPYSSPYYWRVKAVSGTVAAGDLAESGWSTGVFITMEEPEEVTPPVVVEEQPPVIIEPIVEVITPAATEITPAWIYVIIGVGAVLVIALLVLIVRTRRVA